MRPLLLCLFVGLAYPAQAAQKTYRQRLMSDPGFAIYSVFFSVLQNPDSSIKEVSVARVADPRSGTNEPVKIDVPKAYIASARKAIIAHRYDLNLENGKITPFLTYFFYAPSVGSVLIDDLDVPIPDPPKFRL